MSEVELTGDEIDTLVYEAGPDADHDRIVFAVERIIAEREAKAWDEGRSAALAPVAGAPDGTFAKSRYRMRTEDAILALPNPYRTTAEVGE